MPDIYSQKQNAVRAARKAIADGSAPAPTYEIKTAAGGGFRIVWDRLADECHGYDLNGDLVEREEEIDSNEPGDLSPGDERLGEGLRGPTGAEAAAVTKAIGHAPENAPKRDKGNTQLAKVTDLLQRPEGATIAEIQAATGWLPHTTRAFISVQVKKAGLSVVTDKVEGRGRVYRVAA